MKDNSRLHVIPSEGWHCVSRDDFYWLVVTDLGEVSCITVAGFHDKSDAEAFAKWKESTTLREEKA